MPGNPQIGIDGQQAPDWGVTQWFNLLPGETSLSLPDGRRSLVMQRYRTGGTPWIILIDREGRVRFNDFHAEAEQLQRTIQQLGTEAT